MKNVLMMTLLLLLSCEEDCSQKKCTNPIWINATIQSITLQGNKGEIIKYLYQNQEVYLVRGCLECADYNDVVRNCEGKIICEFGGIAGINTCPDFSKVAIKLATIWKN